MTLERLDTGSARAILCVGDLMLDRYVYGEVGRISPEAPVPVLKLTRTEEMPGGAGNVARNVSALGADAVLIGAVGDDAEGRALADQIGALDRVRSDLIAMRGRPTTLKVRYVAGGQQLLRADVEKTSAIDTLSEDAIIEAIKAEGGDVAAVLVSDYAKGVLTGGVLAAINALAAERGLPVAVDPKGEDFAKYGPVDIIKPNAAELAAATGLPTGTDAEIEAALKAALDACAANAIVVTRAAKGMSAMTRGGEVIHLQGEAREVYDVSGAGDTSLAALGLGLSTGGSLREAMGLSITASGIAVGKAGTAAVSADEMRAALDTGRTPRSVGAIALPDLLAQVAAWREAGLTVGFTNGCFDILHPGHIQVIEEAKARCGRLVVGLNSDASVSRLKGPGRPVNNHDARAAVLAALGAVDAVTVFEDDTPAALIAALAPDLLVKGGDYAMDEIVGARDVIAAGGAVHIVPLVEGQSTTAAIARASGETE